jgi:uracil-DNA glycosylase
MVALGFVFAVGRALFLGFAGAEQAGGHGYDQQARKFFHAFRLFSGGLLQINKFRAICTVFPWKLVLTELSTQSVRESCALYLCFMQNTEAAPAVDPQIHASWKSRLADEFAKPYFTGLKRFLRAERAQGAVIYPPGPLIFNAFNSTPFGEVKAVILGQDPYHGPGQAHGLCFSVNPGVRMPPSLVNIFKELNDDLGIPLPGSGCLQAWAAQGVLLLNASLTVRANAPNSHAGKGWESFTDAAIATLSEHRSGLAFLLWGRNAQAKEALIDGSKHLILKAAHPSPYSATGFFGFRHF